MAKNLDPEKYQGVPVITLEQAHAIIAVGLTGSAIKNYVLQDTIFKLQHQHVGLILQWSLESSGHRKYVSTKLGWKAQKLAIAKAEGRY